MRSNENLPCREEINNSFPVAGALSNSETSQFSVGGQATTWFIKARLLRDNGRDEAYVDRRTLAHDWELRAPWTRRLTMFLNQQARHSYILNPK